MKKHWKKLMITACLLLSLFIGSIVYAGAVEFDTTTPTFGYKYVASGTKVSGTVTHAYVAAGDCEEAFGAKIQADNNGWVDVTGNYIIYANESGYMSYTLTPDADTPMRLAIWNLIGMFGGQRVCGSIDYY